MPGVNYHIKFVIESLKYKEKTVMEEKPVITSYTNVASFFSLVKINDATVQWIFDNYSSIEWNEKCKEIRICGLDSMTPYEKILCSPFLDSKTYFSYSGGLFEDLLKEKYYIICPINTQIMGVTTEEIFVHDILIADIKNNCYGVYDFWRPEFIWKKRSVERNILMNAIDYSNPDLYNQIIAIRKKKVVGEVCQRKAEEYDYVKYDKTYDCFIDYIRNIDSYLILPVTSFQILIDHFNLLSAVFQNNYFMRQMCKDMRDKLSDILDDMSRNSDKLRNYVMKIWYSKRNILDWRERIITNLLYLKKQENDFWLYFRSETDG